MTNKIFASPELVPIQGERLTILRAVKVVKPQKQPQTTKLYCTLEDVTVVIYELPHIFTDEMNQTL